MKNFPVPTTIRKKRLPSAIDGFLPPSVIVPLKQESDYSCISCVVPGQTVREGEIIGIPKSDGMLRTCVHAPVPGVVDKVVQGEMPDGRQGLGIKINLRGSFSYLGKRRGSADWKPHMPNVIVNDLAQKGVVNTFLATNPCSLAHQMEGMGLRRRLLIVRLFDESPGRMTDTLLYKTFPAEVLAGVAITAYAAGVYGIALLYDKQTQEAPANLEKENLAIPIKTIAVDSRKFLSGFSRELSSTVRSLSEGDVFSGAGEEDLFVDSSTMMSVYSAVTCDTPVVRRYITIDGDCMKAFALINVTLGMPIRYVIEQCGGLAKQPAAIIINGIMTGSATPSLDAPVTKYVKSISLLSSRRVYDEPVSECTGCGNCRGICPYKLSPDILYGHVTGMKRAWDSFLKSAALCSLCNLCNSVCPARLPISQTIAPLVRRTQNNFKDTMK